MQTYEYRVVPAPKRAEKVKGVRSTPDRFAHALTQLMNDLGRDGWEYQRADTLPCEERVGLTGRATVFQHMLVFRRTLAAVQNHAVQNHAVQNHAAETVAPVATPVAPPVPAPLFARPAAVRPADRAPAERALADYAGLARPVGRKLTSDAPVGEAPRISLVQPLPDVTPTLGPATGEGGKS